MRKSSCNGGNAVGVLFCGRGGWHLFSTHHLWMSLQCWNIQSQEGLVSAFSEPICTPNTILARLANLHDERHEQRRGNRDNNNKTRHATI